MEYRTLCSLISLGLIFSGLILKKWTNVLFNFKESGTYSLIEKLKLLIWNLFQIAIVFDAMIWANFMYFYWCPYPFEREQILKQFFISELKAPQNFGYPYSHGIKSCDNESWYIVPYHATWGSKQIVQVDGEGNRIRGLEELGFPGLNLAQNCETNSFYLGYSNGIAAFEDSPNGSSYSIHKWKISGKPDVVKLSHDKRFFLVRNERFDSQAIDQRTGNILLSRHSGHDLAPVSDSGVLLCGNNIYVYENPFSSPHFVANINFAHWMYCNRDDKNSTSLLTLFELGEVWKLDDQGKISAKWKLGYGIRYSIFDATRRLFFTANYVTGELFAIHVDNGEIAKPIFVGRRTRWLHLSPDSKELIFSSSTGFYRLNIDQMLTASHL